MREQLTVPADAITQWQEDAGFDDSALDLASLNIPLLHGRYLRYLSDARLSLKRLSAKKHQLYQNLSDYYLGRLNDPATLATLARPAVMQRYLRQDVNGVIVADAEYVAFNERVEVAEELVAVLEEILKNINSRGYQIKNAIEWRRLTNFSPL